MPAIIYTIPPTSPLYYVTFVHVYGSTAQVVYVGYTPGYLGTVVTPAGVVVYGTGYAYPTWVGTVWYPPPATYGMMAQPVYNPAAGMAFGFAMGVTTAALAGSAVLSSRLLRLSLLRHDDRQRVRALRQYVLVGYPHIFVLLGWHPQ